MTGLYKWVHGTDEDGEIVLAVMLQIVPYDGVVVEFSGEVSICENGLKYSWRVLSSPGDVEPSSDDPIFTKYLDKIVQDRLSEIAGAVNVERENVNDCGTD